jgi:hypothetical protein
VLRRSLRRLPEYNRDRYKRVQRDLYPLSIMRKVSIIMRVSRENRVLDIMKGSRKNGGSRELKRANHYGYYAGDGKWKTACF